MWSGCLLYRKVWFTVREADALLIGKPMKLTISVEKIDHFLADIKKQVEDLQREMTNLRLARTQLTGCQLENWRNE